MRHILSLDNSDLSKLLHLDKTTDFVEFITCCPGKEVLVQSFLDAVSLTDLVKSVHVRSELEYGSLQHY